MLRERRLVLLEYANNSGLPLHLLGVDSWDDKFIIAMAKWRKFEKGLGLAAQKTEE